jgi:transcriptional regulator with XRE-family HTH domain
MGSQNEIKEFLTSRRARLTPEQAGLPNFGGRRRVPGLRREEVAMLAGMSSEYYIRLERGNATGVSESILDAISRALQLDDAERTHLFNLARGADLARRPSRLRSPKQTGIKPLLRQTIEAMDNVPVFIQNGRLDGVAANALGEALFAPLMDSEVSFMNAARFVFLDQRAQEFYPEWEKVAQEIVPVLRAEAGKSPFDRALTDLVGELSTRSEEFRQLWASQNVREHRTGIKRIHHPLVGDLDLQFEVMTIASEPGLQMFVFSAERGSPSQIALQLLANLSATFKDRSSTNEPAV